MSNPRLPARVRSALIVLAMLCLGLAAPVRTLQAAEVRMTAAQQGATGIETAPPRRASVASVQGLPAQVTVPNQQQRVISAPLAGLVDEVLVATQQSVRRGQLMARLQSPALADAQHTYLQAVSRHALERANLERAEALFTAGVIAERQLLATRAEHAQASIDLAERTQALRLAGTTDAAMERLRGGNVVGTTIELHAPIDGVVVEQVAVVGQRVEQSAPLFRVARLDPLWLEIQVPVARLASIAVGSPIRVEGAQAEGRVISVGRNVTAATQTALVRAEVLRGADRLRSGQMVEATLSGAPADGQWEIPATALVRIEGRAFVFVRTAAGFRDLPVRILGEGGAHAVVAADLKAEDQIAVRGVASLKGALLGIGVN